MSYKLIRFVGIRIGIGTIEWVIFGCFSDCDCRIIFFFSYVVIDFVFAVNTEQSSITIGGSVTSSSSPENTNSDDFVLVPNNLPTDQAILNYDKKWVIFVIDLNM